MDIVNWVYLKKAELIRQNLSDPTDGNTYLYVCLSSTEDLDIPGDVLQESIKLQSSQELGFIKKHVTLPNENQLCSIDIDSDSFGWYYDENSNSKARRRGYPFRG